MPGLTCHSDAGSQFTSIRYGERLAEIGAVPSIGSIGDSLDNASAETVNGYYKAELIYGRPAPTPGRNPIARASGRTSAIQSPSMTTSTAALWAVGSCRIGVLQPLTLNLR